METSETKQPDKPDFEKLSNEVLPNTLTPEGFRLFVRGCNSAWNYHAFPIIRERDALQKENERLKEENFNLRHGYTAGAFEKKELEIAELRDALKNSKEVIENLIAGKRIVNLDEALAYYNSLLKQEPK